MPQYLEDKIPNNGMNRDDENRLVEKNEFRFALNLRGGSSDDDNIGTIENVKGTTEVTFDLPKGNNKVIGSHGDQTTNSNFFFLFNSLGNHTIYRYFPDTREIRILSRDSRWNFSEYDLINDINVIDGELLYFRDIENPPRKININKADNDNPDTRQVFHWYLGDDYLDGETTLDLVFTVQPERYSTAQVPQITETFTVLTPAPDEGKPEIARDLTEQINNGVANGSIALDIEAESCGEFVIITTTSPDYYTITALKGGFNTVMVVPQNHYIGYAERTIDVIKHPPHCELKAQIKTDEKFNRNYLSRKVFQFAARYIYDDDEKSTVDPYSIHIFNDSQCLQFSTPTLNNYIEIDLSVFPELLEPLELQTIRQIELFVRIGELGNWKSITTLEQYQFVDTANQHYDFYNNGRYNPVDQADFVRPFDLVPIRTKNMEIAKNRQFFGNNLEGYDNVCTDAKLDIDYDDVEARIKPPTYTIKGRIDIRAAFNGGFSGALKDHQPIWKDNIGGDDGPVTNPTVWGGIDNKPFKDFDMEDIAAKTGQILPLGGFVVYLAGTDYYGISKQKTGYSGLSDVGQDDNGVFVGSGGSYVDHVREYIIEEGTYGELFSTFEISNVPDGWYYLRVASHQTVQGDLDSGERGYQRTSTNAFQFVNPNFLSGGFTYIEEAGSRNEILVHVSAGNISNLQNIGISIMDLSYANKLGSTKILSGYVVDSDITGSISTYSEAIADTRISRALVTFDKSAATHHHFNTVVGGQPIPSDPINDWAYDYWLQEQEPGAATETDTRTDGTITDHNGFFFFASSQSMFKFPFISDGKLSIENIRPANDPSSIGQYNGVLYSQQGGTNSIKENSFAVVASRAPAGASNLNRTKVTGVIEDQNSLGIPKASIISSRTATHETDSTGEFEFFHYGILDRSGVIGGAGVSGASGAFKTLLFPSQSAGTCSASFSDSEIYNFNFDYPNWYVNNFSPDLTQGFSALVNSAPLTLDIAKFIGDSSGMKTINAFKRGFDGQLGIIYYDRGMRSGSVNTEEKLKMHIPFYSEKDEDGNPSPPGVPVVSWEVRHRPPSWATHWQWARTRNLTVGNYLQWATDEVTYTLDDGVTPSTFQSGSRVVLGVSNIATLRNKFPSLDYELGLDDPGMRVRFIKRYDGQRYTEYLDYPLLENSSLGLVIEKDFAQGEIKAGTLFEVYNELLDIEEEIYYEFGECFEVKQNVSGIKYHAGLAQDQNPLLPASIPATGTFRTGDAYYRLRSMPRALVNEISYIDDDAVSDFYRSEVESIGRANGINPDAAQLWKPNQIRHSGKYIPDSKVNNLSQFISDRFQPLPIEFGAINKLQLAANVLMSIHEFRWVSNYIEEAIVRKQAGDDDIVATTSVFGSFRAAKQITGTVNQESVKEYRGAIWAFDLNKGEVYRWAADGLTAISQYKMINYFSDKSEEILRNKDLGEKPFRAIGVYNSRHDEYILSFGEIAKKPTEDVPVAPPLPEFRFALDVNNSEIIEEASDNALYTINGSKESGSVFILDEATAPNLKGVQIDNQIGSEGDLLVKVKRLDGSIEEVVRLEEGQGIADFNIQTRKFNPKPRTNDAQTVPAPQGQILVSGETVAFSERINKWTTFYSFRPEMFGIISLEMIGFSEGRLWIHNDNVIRNNFYGVQYPSQIEALFNQEPGQVKVFEAVGIESYHPWHVPSMKTPNGMETQMVAGRFVRREDSYFSPVMRDINTPNFGNQFNEAILNGRQLRDRTATVLFQNDETGEVVLFAYSMKSTLSPRHQK